jgi:hypothetical protein
MMKASARIIAVALLTLALAGFPPAAATAHAAPVPAQAVHAVPIAIDLHGLFGDENEPDENEPDEGSDQSASQSEDGDGASSGVSLPVVAILVLAAAALGGFVYLRIRRAWLRLRGWSRSLWARD